MHVLTPLKIFTLVLAVLMLFAGAASAEDYVVTLKDNQFTPQDLAVPAGQKIKIVVRNVGNKAAEFESEELKREKVVSPNSEITVMIGPLQPGTYAYVDDFHRQAKGTITAK